MSPMMKAFGILWGWWDTSSSVSGARIRSRSSSALCCTLGSSSSLHDTPWWRLAQAHWLAPTWAPLSLKALKDPEMEVFYRLLACLDIFRSSTLKHIAWRCVLLVVVMSSLVPCFQSAHALTHPPSSLWCSTKRMAYMLVVMLSIIPLNVPYHCLIS